ncbi:hypothetical protein KIPB_012465, partial [Kipferlia bialata]|eukprot:g12465.t1
MDLDVSVSGSVAACEPGEVPVEPVPKATEAEETEDNPCKPSIPSAEEVDTEVEPLVVEEALCESDTPSTCVAEDEVEVEEEAEEVRHPAAVHPPPLIAEAEAEAEGDAPLPVALPPTLPLAV